MGGPPGRPLVWADLSAAQLAALRRTAKGGVLPRDAVAAATGLVDPSDPPTAIVLDLYLQTLQHAEDQGLSDEQASALFSVVRAVHDASTSQALTVDASFTLLRDLLVAHSVQRPPYSVRIFSLAQVQATTDWLVSTYYAHYRLYQYAFTSRVTLNLTSALACECVEAAPAPPPLSAALTEEQYQVSQAAAARQREEEAKAAAEAAAAAAEAEREARMQAAYEATMPDEVQAKVAAAMQAELDKLRLTLEQQFSKQEAFLRARISQLEAKSGVVPTT